MGLTHMFQSVNGCPKIRKRLCKLVFSHISLNGIFQKGMLVVHKNLSFPGPLKDKNASFLEWINWPLRILISSRHCFSATKSSKSTSYRTPVSILLPPGPPQFTTLLYLTKIHKRKFLINSGRATILI